MLNKIGITFLGDSIMKYNKNSSEMSWLLNVRKKLKNKFKNKITIYSKQVIGLNSRGLINLISDYYPKVKNKQILVIQIGINDSWYYESMKGLPEVSVNSFKRNLEEVYKKSIISGYENITLINYHKLMNNRIEINKRSLNFNLKKYNEVIRDFCKKKRLQLIDINKKSLDGKNYCLPLPDGIHLNRNGVKLYSNIILNYLIKIINEKNI